MLELLHIKPCQLAGQLLRAIENCILSGCEPSVPAARRGCKLNIVLKSGLQERISFAGSTSGFYLPDHDTSSFIPTSWDLRVWDTFATTRTLTVAFAFSFTLFRVSCHHKIEPLLWTKLCTVGSNGIWCLWEFALNRDLTGLIMADIVQQQACIKLILNLSWRIVLDCNNLKVIHWLFADVSNNQSIHTLDYIHLTKFLNYCLKRFKIDASKYR